jgi:hypothetical protein
VSGHSIPLLCIRTTPGYSQDFQFDMHGIKYRTTETWICIEKPNISNTPHVCFTTDTNMQVYEN